MEHVSAVDFVLWDKIQEGNHAKLIQLIDFSLCHVSYDRLGSAYLLYLWAGLLVNRGRAGVGECVCGGKGAG